MKESLFLITVLFLVTFAYPQEAPTLKVGEKQLGLSSLDIKVEIVGNVATTTFEMLFYNPTNVVLEGELSFPLGEGHNVSRFALDVNGNLREAVVVEKELGRIAFENVVRRGVDPAILEKGTGNNYKARIYPIPAKGYKKVLLAYEQELIFTKEAHYYNLPLSFTNRLDHFKLDITVFDQKRKPAVEEGQISGLTFSNWKKNYSTSVEKKNFIANRNVLIKIPLSIGEEKIVISDNYFYAYKFLSPQNRLRKKPKSITLYWDASLSMKDKDLNIELDFLNSFFEYNENLKVRFISFSNTILLDREFTIKDGNWSGLKKKMETVVYDGGTSYKTLQNTGGYEDAKLIFTDGITTLSNLEIKNNCPVFIINSLIKSNHVGLGHKAEMSGGSYINLKIMTISEAMSKIKHESYKFLGYSSNNKKLEVYPKLPVSVSNDFSIAGKGFKNGDIIALNFGYGNDITQKISYTINSKNTTNRGVPRLWAQKKLNHLEKDTKNNEVEITSLGKKYGLVTDYTSLIVLEDVRDYITYKISPPEELLEEYNRLLNLKDDNKGFVRFERTVPSSDDVIEIIEDNVELEESIIESDVMDLQEIVYEEEIAEDIPFSIIEEVPVFPGCTGTSEEKKTCFSQSVNKHIEENFNAQLANSLNLLPGVKRIFTMFTINRQGAIVNIRVRAPHNELAGEAVRVLQLLPLMIPGKQGGRNVSVKYALPIVFKVKSTSQPSGSFGEEQSVILEANLETRNDVEEREHRSNYSKYSGVLKIKNREVFTKYLIELRKTKNKEEAYQLYLEQREDFMEIPAYFIDVSNYFENTYKGNSYGSRILSNIAETDFDNYELLKVFAYQLQVNNRYDLAVFINKRILDLRPEDSQSYRDLALAYMNIGKCQESLDLLNSIVSGEIYEDNKNRRVFKGIKEIAKNEMRYLIQNFKDDLDISKIDKKLLENVNYDLRIVVDWNHNDTDIDLHIIDPNLEECFYSHSSTEIGGRISQDMTQGFGPEEFILKNAIKGSYYVKIKYFGDRYQKIENPTFMKVSIYKKYGLESETKETQIIRLTKNDDEEIVAKVIF